MQTQLIHKKGVFISVQILAFLLLLSFISEAQKTKVSENCYVDKAGIMRYSANDEEVHGFGVNYTLPFAHAYRSAKKLGIDPKKAIDNDVYHFSRLGFDLFRVHVWDTEISDSLGNLIENEQLDAFDYLLKKLNDNGIRSVLTPIAFWGNGWPEPDESTTGFSHKYGKADCLTNPEAIKAQANYLTQFMNYVNPYTGIAYKNDPNILAIEISNEPHHKESAEEVTKFIRQMLKAVQKSGSKKPVFYNVSHSVHLAEAYFKSGIHGGTFQWYPSGLGYQQELSGNLLPNVNDYHIPFDDVIKKYKGAKLVYEFDAADVGKSYIYPAMARSFREAGIQLATHFAYDPTFLAYANTEYNTHYMNLAYTPQKALSLMISAEIFHKVPMNKSFGVYPVNLAFDDFLVDYKNDLALYNSDKKFIYTNSHSFKPKDQNKLELIAGFGNSELIKYDGLGAYFLDKLENGVWRLEVMPDAIWIDNPFGKNSLNKTVAVIQWNNHKMQIDLSDLGADFEVEAVNRGNESKNQTSNGEIFISPGTYILSKKGINKKWSASDKWKSGLLSDFYAPSSTLKKPYFLHKSQQEASESSSIEIDIEYISPEKPQQIDLLVFVAYNRKIIPFQKNGLYSYQAIIPQEMLSAGILSYQIIIKQNNGDFVTYPAEKKGKPFDWDFYDRSTYQLRIVPENYPIHLFNAASESDLLVKEWRNTFKLIPTAKDLEYEYQMNIEQLFQIDNENLFAEPIYDYSFKHFIIERIKSRKSDLDLMKNFVFNGRSLNDKPCKLQIAFVMDNGASFGGMIEIGPESKDYYLSLDNIKPVKTVTLPRPYPTFLPYYFEHDLNETFDIQKIESIQFSIGPGIPEKELNVKHGIAIISCRLE